MVEGQADEGDIREGDALLYRFVRDPEDLPLTRVNEVGVEEAVIRRIERRRIYTGRLGTALMRILRSIDN